MIFDAAGERLYLRAMLETIRDQGWKADTIPEAWKSEPITAALALEAIKGLHDWKRRRVYEGMPLLSLMLVHHMGSAANGAATSLGSSAWASRESIAAGYVVWGAATLSRQESAHVPARILPCRDDGDGCY